MSSASTSSSAFVSSSGSSEMTTGSNASFSTIPEKKASSIQSISYPTLLALLASNSSSVAVSTYSDAGALQMAPIGSAIIAFAFAFALI